MRKGKPWLRVWNPIPCVERCQKDRERDEGSDEDGTNDIYIDEKMMTGCNTVG